MPDISLLQNEYYAPEEEKSRLPGVVSIGGFVALILAISAYTGLFFYERVLALRAEEIAKNIANVNVGEIAQTTQEVKTLGMQARNLAALRQAHTYPSKLFAHLERTTHPAVSFSDASINMKNNTVSMGGITESPVLLARQVEIYEKEKKEGRISDFTIDGVGYGKEKKVLFKLTLAFPKL